MTPSEYKTSAPLFSNAGFAAFGLLMVVVLIGANFHAGIDRQGLYVIAVVCAISIGYGIVTRLLKLTRKPVR